MSSRKAQQSLRQAAWLYDMLLLVMKKPPTIWTIQRLTANDFLACEEWAAVSHLAASDNPVRVQAKPACLEHYT